MVNTVTSIIGNTLYNLSTYLPQFFAGLLILLIGIVIASIFHHLVIVFFKVIKIDKWLQEAHLTKDKEHLVWPDIIAELIRWSVLILFLVPAVEAWGLPRATEVLNQLLLYIPNVFVAVLIAFIGLVVANLAFDIVRHAIKGVGGKQSVAIATLARYTIVFFTALIALNQLGVASDLIRILFTGIVAMIAIAGGLAFGLGGKDIASEILEALKGKLDK